MTRRAIALGALLCLPALPGEPTLAAGADPDAPLTNEAIVLMTVEGTPEKEILARISSAGKVSFDLDEEILTEMRLVGVTDAVIAAMKQRALAGVPPPAAPVAAPRGKLELLFPIDPNQETWRQSIAVPGRTPDAKPIGLALFVICTDPTHVPHMWQTKSQLAETIPRHEMLWFQDKTAPVAQRKNSPVYAPLPPSVALDLAAGPHALEIGAVVRIGDEAWFFVVSGKSSLEVPAAGTLQAEVRLRTTGSAQTFPRPGAKLPYSVEIISR
jgi:hypothetical protein